MKWKFPQAEGQGAALGWGAGLLRRCPRETVQVNRERAHGQHRSHASVGKGSHETVHVDVEPCDLPEAVFGKHGKHSRED
eukprot:3728968-Amphidinium_carterae.1